jgi:hypothetical protein
MRNALKVLMSLTRFLINDVQQCARRLPPKEGEVDETYA